MSSSKVAAEPVAPYVSRPPDWLKRAHASADVGYSGFFPPVPSAREEQLNEQTAQHGYISQPEVNAENFNAKAEVTKAFKTGNTLDDLKQLLDAVIERRAENAAKLPPTSFKIPGRVTFNEARRVNWVSELANPDVPLHKIGKSVPHGFKGHDLLEMLETHKVAVPRAVWYVRVLGANETQGMRNRPNFHPAMYSVEWANVVTSYFKKLLDKIALPSAPRAALNIKQTFNSILANTNAREEWLAKFTYILDLTREFYVESLVDHPTFLSWLAQLMSGSNLAQAGFATCLLEDYFDGLLSHRVFARPLIEGCLSKLNEIDASPVKENLGFLASAIKTILQRAFPVVPDAFVSPGMWTTYSPVLRDMFRDASDFTEVEQRNDALAFRTLPVREMDRVRSMMSEIQALNAVTMDTDLTALARRNSSLALLLTWAASPAQHGVHRPFLVATLIARRAEYEDDPDALQNALIEWMDGSDECMASQSARGAARLMGELARVGLFSYERFLQRILARGDTERHQATLRAMPVWKENGVILRQRKIALYGVRAGSRETEEDHIQRAIRAEIRQELPYFFGGSYPATEPSGTLRSRMPTLFGAHKFEQVRTVAHWLLPIAMDRLKKCSVMDTAVVSKNYSVLSEVLAATHCFSSLCELNIAVLQKATAPELLMAVISNLRRFAFIFKCMDVIPTLDGALAVSHHSIRSRPAQLRSLLALLQVLNRGDETQSATLHLVAADVDASVQALRPPLSSPEEMPSLDLELAQLALDPAPNAPSILAHGLWSKFKTKANWGLSAAESTFASLRQFTPETMPPQPPPDTAGKFATFLWEVDQLLAGDLDAHLLECFRGPVFTSSDEMRVCDATIWNIVVSIAVELVVRGCASTQTILRGLVYPAWTLGSYQSVNEEEGGIYESFLLASVQLGHSLLICTVNQDEDMPPRGLAECQQLKARRAMLYDDGEFSELVTALRSLVAWESSPNERLKEAASSLRTALQVNREFWFIARKNLDLVRDVFLTEQPPSESLVEMLRSILGDPANALDHEEEVATTDWQNISSRVNPWTFARTSINLHLTLQELVKGLVTEETRPQAERDLDTFTAGLFDSAVTAEETDLLGDVLRGISGPVVAKFVNNGIRRLTLLLEESAADDFPPDIVEPYLRRAGEVLRLLAGVLAPLRDDPGKIPAIEAEVQDDFVRALHKKLSVVESKLSHVGDALDLAIQVVVFLARMLQFSLGLGRAWSDRLKDCGVELMDCIVRMCIAFGGGVLTDQRTFTILLDTASIMVDDYPKDPKTAAADLFRNIPTLDPARLPGFLPHDFNQRLVFILPYRPSNHYTSDLVYAHPETNGSLTYGAPVQHRPWEWIESIEARNSPTLDEHGEHVVANSTSIPLELFGARPTAERVYTGDEPARLGDLLLQQDTFASGSVFENDWRQSRLARNDAQNLDAPSPAESGEHEQQESGPAVDPFQHEPSPAPTVLSRTSAFAGSASASSRRGSPAIQMGRGGTAEQQGTMSSRGSKRKASTASSSVIEIDDGPDEAEQSRPTAAKRRRARPAPATATRARGKKK
ncbi:hypothetical protein EXIGLDRAFT_435689 [Exidia glandulosa HHB12029]|uniref:Mediator of RNA polymerase II transcription subunit 12 n=1 Tax=Exidia glandulosa HHB12029 TaxID=1314781 RepID=A0A166AYJ9_EXIGL|nr:hypothetical protein EXIGLDRAFT_435689 [Exidia glandulosa HHB12029]